MPNTQEETTLILLKPDCVRKNLSVTPAGNQMKCPIPRDGNASPRFQETSPLIVPAHSFCQIFRAIFAFTSPVSGAA